MDGFQYLVAQAQTQNESNERREPQAEHDFYDDGLVHDHGWARDSSERS